MRLPRKSEPTPGFDLSAAAWVTAIGVVGVGFYLLRVALDTSFFFANGIAATFTPLQVWGTCALLALQAVCAIWQRNRPVLTFVAVMVLLLVSIVLARDRDSVVGVPMLFAVANIAARRRWRDWLPLVAGAAVADFGTQLGLIAALRLPLSFAVVFVRVVETLTPYVFALAIGLLVGVSRRRAELSAHYASALEREQAALLGAAVMGERNRMARELHDVTAHHLSGVLAQVRLATRGPAKDSQASAAAMAAAEREGELAVESLHQLVSVLRDHGAGPTLSSLPELIENVRATNSRVSLTVDGEIADLSPVTSLACYRIIQESLSNVRKHSPGATVSVSVMRGPTDIVVEVRNSAPLRQADRIESAFGGFGVVGMRERATILGGELVSAKTAEGGWLTMARIPLAQLPQR